VVARVRAADASVGAAIDVGAGRVRGQAVAANGDLLVVRNPGGSSAAGLEISTVTGAGAVSAAMPFAPAGGAAVTGYWSVAARPVGGFLAVTSMPDDSAPEGTVLAGMALDAAGTPSAAPVFWAAGRNAALAGDRLLFVDRIEDGASASSHATAIAFDAAGTPGAPVVLAQARQRLVPRECGGGCGVASVNRRGPSVAGLLFLLVLGALVASGRPGSLRWRSGASSACARRRRRPAGGPGRGPPR
jgi:hypothetical protein